MENHVFTLHRRVVQLKAELEKAKAGQGNTDQEWQARVDEVAGQRDEFDDALQAAQDRIAALREELNATQIASKQSQGEAATLKNKAAVLEQEVARLGKQLADRPEPGIEHEVIHVPIATKRQKALEQAIAYYIKEHPESSAGQVIEEYARQILSGLGDTPSVQPSVSQGE